MINARLMNYLEINKILTNIQSGCRQNLSTLDYLVGLEHEVSKAFVLGEHQVSIFFDLEKAYDMTWRRGILRDLETAGLKSYFPKYIEQFLGNRYFKVRLENYTSGVYPQQYDVPQRSILAVTLFALEINSVADLIEQQSRLMSSLYVGDLQIGYRHSDLNITKVELQQCLNRLHEWTKKNGFKFSITKTKIMHFTIVPCLHNRPLLKLGSEIILYTDCVKFLGLLWDPKLTWTKHISKLRTECSKLIGVLKTVTNHQ